MGFGRARWTAVAAALVLGVGGGAVTAVLTASEDPLGLGIPMENLDCTGESILIVAYGSNTGGLAAAKSDHKTAHYLRIDDSCDTAFTPPDYALDADYAVYLGPYESVEAACRDRMTEPHESDHVTRLRDGNEIYVKCPCEIPTLDIPTLVPGPPSTTDTVEGMWIRQLQGMLITIGRLPDTGQTGIFDTATFNAVTRIQRFKKLDDSGTVDRALWEELKGRACPQYVY